MNDQTLKDIDRAFKALEERDELLDNIKAEIKQLPTDYCGGYTGLNMEDVIQIIDKYKGESEDEE